jgi:hypothetical protein
MESEYKFSAPSVNCPKMDGKIFKEELHFQKH